MYGFRLGLIMVATVSGCWGGTDAVGEDGEELACSLTTSEPEGCDAAVWTRLVATAGERASVEALVADPQRVYAAVRACDESSCSTELVAFDGDGEMLWTREADGVTALAIAPDGGVYGARALDLGGDGSLSRWAADGTALWSAAHTQVRVSLDVDADGAYVGGTSFVAKDEEGALGSIVAVQADGTPSPEVVLDVHGVSQVRRIDDGFVLVNWGNALVRVDEGGTRQWLTIVDEGPGHAFAGLDAIALADQDVLAVGNPQPPEGHEKAPVEVFRVSLADGAVLDRYPIGLRTHAIDSPSLVSRFEVFSNASAVHVTWGVEHIHVYQPDGASAWEQAYEGPATASQVALATAPDGSFVVAGTGAVDGSAPAWWLKRFSGP